MKNHYKNALIFLATSTLLVGCDASHKVELEREEAKNKVNEAYQFVLNIENIPEVYSFQSLDSTGEEKKTIGISFDKDNKTLFYQYEDEVAIGFNPVEDEEESEEISFEEYTFNYSIDGGENFLEEPLVGEEAIAKFEEYAIKANALLSANLVEQHTLFDTSLSKLELLETSYEEKEEYEEGDILLDLSELYFENDYRVHFGYKYQYGPLVYELDEEGEIVKDEEDNDILIFDEQDELYNEDYLSLDLEKIDDHLYPSSFKAPGLISQFEVDTIIFMNEINPEE